jgi:hypothetical protein
MFELVKHLPKNWKVGSLDLGATKWVLLLVQTFGAFGMEFSKGNKYPQTKQLFDTTLILDGHGIIVICHFSENRPAYFIIQTTGDNPDG